MIQAICTYKFREGAKIYGYRLQDINGKKQDVTPDDLKNAIRAGKINVVNLKLTKDNRLVDKAPEKQLEDTKLMPNKVNHNDKGAQNKDEKLVSKNQSHKSNFTADTAKSVAVRVYKELGYATPALELGSFDNSYGDMIDKRFEPEILYRGEPLVLAVTYMGDKNKLYLALEDMRGDESYVERFIEFTPQNAVRLIKAFVNDIKANLD